MSDPHSAEARAKYPDDYNGWSPQGIVIPSLREGFDAGRVSRDAEVAELKAKIAESQAIVAELLDPDPCNWDHNHSCQGHGFYYIPQGEMCPNERGRQYVAASSPVEGHDSTCDGLEGCPNPAAHSVEGGN